MIYLFVLRTVRLLRILYVLKSQRRNLKVLAISCFSRYSLIVGSHVSSAIITYLLLTITGILLVLRFAVLGMMMSKIVAAYSNPPTLMMMRALNFENIGSSFIVLFFICIRTIAGTGRCCRGNGSTVSLYFIIWYIFSMMLLTNCITSFSIDCFALLNKARKRKSKKATWQRILHDAPGFLSEFDVRQSKLNVNSVYFDKFLDEIQGELETSAKIEREQDQLNSDIGKQHSLVHDMLRQTTILGNLRRRLSTSAAFSGIDYDDGDSDGDGVGGVGDGDLEEKEEKN